MTQFKPEMYVRMKTEHRFIGDVYAQEATVGSIGILERRAEEDSHGPLKGFVAWEVEWVKHPDDFPGEDSSCVDEECLEEIVFVNDRAFPTEISISELDEVYALLGVQLQESLFDAMDENADAT